MPFGGVSLAEEGNSSAGIPISLMISSRRMTFSSNCRSKGRSVGSSFANRPSVSSFQRSSLRISSTCGSSLFLKRLPKNNARSFSKPTVAEQPSESPNQTGANSRNARALYEPDQGHETLASVNQTSTVSTTATPSSDKPNRISANRKLCNGLPINAKPTYTARNKGMKIQKPGISGRRDSASDMRSNV